MVFEIMEETMRLAPSIARVELVRSRGVDLLDMTTTTAIDL